jgi:hypothetical protein
VTDKLCLRCDWSGSTKEVVCPSCGSQLFRPPGAPPARTRWRPVRRERRRSRRSRRSEALATPTAESFDPAVPDEAPTQAAPVSRRAGWMAGAVVLAVALVLGVVVQRATPPAPPIAPAPGLQGDLVFAASEIGDRSRLWIWDLATGEIREGPVVGSPVKLVDAYRAAPGEGWIGVVSTVAGRQEAALLRNFATTDVPTPVLRGQLVDWSTGGDLVVSATKSPEACSELRVESFRFGADIRSELLDQPICGRLTGLGLDDATAHVGLEDGELAWVARVWQGSADPWIEGVSLVAVAEGGGALVTTSCLAPNAGSATCGALAYADPALPGDDRMIPYADDEVGMLMSERFLGWSRDGRTGFVLGTYGDVRGVYAVTPARARPRPPRLIVASVATEVYVAESSGSGGGELFISRDGGLLLVRADGEQVPLVVPDGAPSPDGPIVWLASAGGV